MADIVKEIKKIVKEYLQNESLSDCVFGTYLTNGGLKIDNKPIAIPKDMVCVPLHLKEGTNAIKAGDKVIIMQSQGSQRYAIIGRV